MTVSAPHVEEEVLDKSQGRHALELGDGEESRYPTRSKVTMAMLLDADFTFGTFMVDSIANSKTVFAEPKSFKEAPNAPNADKWWVNSIK